MVQIDWNMAPDAWKAALARCPDATFFHTEAWLETMHRTFGSRVERVRVRFDDDRWALLPLTVRPLARGLLPLATAGEIGAYSGLVSPSPLSAHDEAAAYMAVRRRYADLWVVGNPFGAHPAAGMKVRGATVETETTHVLALKPIAELRQGFSRGAKSRGNKARKAGLTLRVSTDPADAALYFALYEDTVRRWGEKLTWARPLAFYENMMELGAPATRLFIAYDGDRPVSALLFAAYGATAHYVAGATLAEALPVCPSNFLMEEALAYYAEAGCRTFDFGPSNGLAGVVQFKESFGAVPVAFDTQRAVTLAGRLYFALRRHYDQFKRRAAEADAPATTPAIPAV